MFESRLILLGPERVIGRGLAAAPQHTGSCPLDRIGEWEAVELHDPSRTAERRSRRAVTTAHLPDRATRFVEPAGHDWEVDVVSPYGEAGTYGQAYVACTKVSGRFVWRRAATFEEVTALGADLG